MSENANLLGLTTGFFTVATIENPVSPETALERIRECQLPYDTYRIEHDGETFTVKHDQETYTAWEESNRLAETVCADCGGAFDGDGFWPLTRSNSELE